MLKSVVLFLLGVLVPFALSATISWTGGGGNQLWSFATNWQGNAIPTANDDVVINLQGGAQVSVSAPAAARSVTIAGGASPQFLSLLSQLAVGAGGISVFFNGQLLIASNNQLPLSSIGPVIIRAGAAFTFQSGSINGPGNYTVETGASLLFSQSSLKQISATSLISFGQATIQSSSIQLAASGSFISRSNLTVFGGVLIFSSDSTATGFQNWGPFVYHGTTVTQPLTLQAATVFGSNLDIASGGVTLGASFLTNSTVTIPSGSILTIAAGTSQKTLNIVKGQGQLVVQGIATVAGLASVTTLQVTDSGTLSLGSGGSFTTATVGGRLQTQTTVTLTNLTLAGGTIAGPGTTTVSGNLLVAHADTGNNNNFIAGNLILSGVGLIEQDAYLLFSAAGILHIASSANLIILANTNFNIQSGSPVVIVDGTISITLPAGVISSIDVNFEGAGTLKVNAGTLVFTGDVVTLGVLFLADPSFITFSTVVVTIGAVTGTGGFNLTAAPSPVSTLGSVALNYFGIPNGAVNIGSFAVNVFDFWSGTVKLASGSSNSASTFNLFGGDIVGTAKLTLTTFNIVQVLPIEISGLAIKSNVLSLSTPSTGSIQTSSGTTILAGAFSSSTLN